MTTNRKLFHAFEKLIEKYPYREVELKVLGLVLETDAAKIPVLVGPTSTGKTVIVRDIQKELGAFLKVLLLQQENPDEVAGYMVPSEEESKKKDARNGYGLHYAKPPWFKDLEESDKELRIVFLDELDKPPRELVAPLLTFIRDRKLRKWSVPEGTLLIAAMNPPRETLSEPLIARLVFIPWMPNKEHYAALFPQFGNLIESFTYKDKIELPQLASEPDLATLHFLHEARKHLWFWEKNVRELLVHGMLAEEAAVRVLREFDGRLSPPTDVMIKDPDLTRKIIRAMREEDVFVLYKEMHPLFCNQDPTETRVFGEFQYWVWEDDTGMRAKRYQEAVQNISNDDHAKFALHAETWQNEIKPPLNGNGTKESFEGSLIHKAQMCRYEIEHAKTPA